MSKDKIKKQNEQKEEKESFQKGSFNLSKIGKKAVTASFTGSKISSNGGLLLIREVDEQIGLTDRIAECIEDQRHLSYIKHSVQNLLSQRIYQIMAGYEDCNDCNYLKDDAVLKICADKLPTKDDSLASQPTMSRFENSLSKKELYNIAVAFLDVFINSFDREPEIIILDSDDTNTNTYGGQQLTLFNEYYHEYCYLPLHIYEGISGKLITTILKPGKRSKSIDVFAIMKRIISYLRQFWKKTRIVVRGDSHFCSKELMDWIGQQKKVNFLTGLSGNNILKTMCATTIESAENKYTKTQNPVKQYHSFYYKADTWEHKQRVIAKVEVNSMGTNVRYIVTDLHEFRTKGLYEKGYCARGNMELRIKDHKRYLKSDRMSCNSFWANQMRLFMHSAAYILMHTFQKEVLKHTEYYNATMETIKLRIIKIAARITEQKTKIKVEFPADFPEKYLFEKSIGIFEILRC